MDHVGNGAYLVGVAFWVFIGVVSVAGLIADHLKRRLNVDLLRTIIEKGQPLDPALVARLLSQDARDERTDPMDLKLGGIITTASGAGIFLTSYFVSRFAPSALYPMMAAASIAICVGIGLIIGAKVMSRCPRTRAIGQVGHVRPGLPAGALAAASEVSIVLLAMNGDDAAYGELVRRRQESIQESAAAPDAQRGAGGRSCATDLRSGLAVDSHPEGARRGWRLVAQARSELLAAKRPQLEAGTAPRGGPARRASGFHGRPAAGSRCGARTACRAMSGLCIVLAYSEGMSHGEICQTAAIPLGTVKSHITRGSARLRELLQGYGDTHVGRN